MMKTTKLIISLLLIICCISAASQNHRIVDSIIDANKNKSAQQLTDSLNKYAEIYRNIDRSVSYSLSEKALDLAKQNKYHLAQAIANKNIGALYFFKGEGYTANMYYNKAIELYGIANDTTGIADCLNNMGLVMQETGKYDSAFIYYDSAAYYYNKTKDLSGLAYTYINKAEVNIFEGNNNEAFDLLDKAYKLFDKIDDEYGKMMVLNDRSHVWATIGNYKNAIKDIKKYIESAEKANNKYNLVLGYGNLAIYYFHTKQIDDALEAIDVAISYGNEEDDGYGIFNIYLTLSDIYHYQQRYNDAIVLLQKVLKHYEATNNKLRVANTFTKIGRNLLELEQIPEAKDYFLQSFEIANEIGAKYEISESLYNLMIISSITRDFGTTDSLNELYRHYLKQIDYDIDDYSVDNGNFEQEKSSALAGQSTNKIFIYSILFFIIVLPIIIIIIKKVNKNTK